MLHEQLPSQTATLLVVDDQPLNIQVLVHILGTDYEVLTASSGAQALEICAQRLPDLILLDVMMDHMDGHEVCRRLKAELRTKDVPVIFVTAQNEPGQEVEGLRLGAVDFISQPINAVVVRARVRTHLQLRQAQRQLWDLAFHDPLTGLPNRRLLNDRISQAMIASQRSLQYGAVMFLDLDNFKPLNDQHGHDVGDLLLVEATGRLKGCVREMDTVARFGGDEFVVVLHELASAPADSRKRATAVAEKIRTALGEPYHLTYWSPDGVTPVQVEHRCTTSIGVALFLGRTTTTADLITWADSAMYAAKDAGRNTIRFYE
jgi:diguanylate cyclase (GGDEF)-like protein